MYAINLLNAILKKTPVPIVGVEELDRVLTVLLNTAMFVGGVVGFVLDNTVKGTCIA